MLLCFLFACTTTSRIAERLDEKNKRKTPLPERADPSDLIDATFATEGGDPLGPLESVEITRIYNDRHAEAMRERRAREEKMGKDLEGRPMVTKEKNILLLSGGGVYGSYTAGVLCGWSTSDKAPGQGGRPVFDVVTGISSGGLIAPLAFLGSDYDEQLKYLYTQLTADDIFERRRRIRSYFAESLNDNARLKQRIDCVINTETMVKIAAEHAKGRRLYIGSTNLDTKRLVVWDLGAMAAKGTETDRQLMVQVILASASIPGFFPSVRFTVTIDGTPYEELHVDGAITRSMFFRPPYTPPDEGEAVGPNALAGSNLYAIVAGKYYPDPEGVKARTISVVGASVSNLLYATTRGDLYRFYTYCLLSGMDYFTTAVPADLKVTNNSTNFDREEMAKLFKSGFDTGKNGAFKPTTRPDPKSEDKPPKPYLYADGTPVPFKDPTDGWRSVPPGLASGERGRNRSGLALKWQQPALAPSRPQGTDQPSGGSPPVVK